MAYAQVMECKGKLYITPLGVGLNGISWDSKSDAEYVARAVNLAHEAGAESVRYAIRELLNVQHPIREGC